MKNYMKSIFILTIGLSCLNFYGCANSDKPLYDPSVSSETITETTLSIEETTLHSETEIITPLKQAVQDISGAYAQNGTTPPELALMCFTEEADSSGTITEIDKNKLPMKDGTLEIGLNLLVYSPEEVNQKIKGTFVLFWNDKPYDFSVNGEKSKDGALSLELLYNQEVVYPFEADDLPVQQGENTLYICFIPYCEETGLYLTPQRYYAYFNSEQSIDGCEPIAITDEKELPQDGIEVITDKHASSACNCVDRADIISSKEEKYTLHATPTFNLNIITNLTHPDEESNRSGIGMLIDDGELQPVWNDKKYLSVSLSADEMRKTISAETSYQSGEKHNICMLYAELEDDHETDGEPFSYSEMAYCTIEE